MWAASTTLCARKSEGDMRGCCAQTGGGDQPRGCLGWTGLCSGIGGGVRQDEGGGWGDVMWPGHGDVLRLGGLVVVLSWIAKESAESERRHARVLTAWGCDMELLQLLLEERR